MCLTNYIKVLIGSLTILTLTTLVSVNSQAQTTCTTNALGDRTCTTVTSGTTTGNILDNSTFGTGNTTTTAGTYIVFETPDANTFTTTKALDGTGSVTLYDAIFFAERFTIGPYAIQNAGDQIKVTLNVSLD